MLKRLRGALISQLSKIVLKKKKIQCKSDSYFSSIITIVTLSILIMRAIFEDLLLFAYNAKLSKRHQLKVPQVQRRREKDHADSILEEPRLPRERERLGSNRNARWPSLIGE